MESCAPVTCLHRSRAASRSSEKSFGPCDKLNKNGSSSTIAGKRTPVYTSEHRFTTVTGRYGLIEFGCFSSYAA